MSTRKISYGGWCNVPCHDCGEPYSRTKHEDYSREYVDPAMPLCRFCERIRNREYWIQYQAQRQKDIAEGKLKIMDQEDPDGSIRRRSEREAENRLIARDEYAKRRIRDSERRRKPRNKPFKRELRATEVLRALGGHVKSRRQLVLGFSTMGKCLNGTFYYAIDRAIAHGQIVMHEDGSIHLAK
jgi:hypothetical protein